MSHDKLPSRRSASFGRQTAAAVACLLAAASLAGLGCGEGATIGQSCAESSDCADELQCLAQICTPRCLTHDECGEGFTCESGGNCIEVLSSIGDVCTRELDCGPGQACRLAGTDPDGDGLLGGTCQADGPGGAVGGDCIVDSDCRSGTCAIGRCSEICADDGDCPASMTCTRLPRIGAATALSFNGCLQATGTLSLDIPTGLPVTDIEIPVPGNALSFAMISSIDDDTQLVGAARLTSPSNVVLYTTPFQPSDYYKNAIRHQPEIEISTLLVPNTPLVSLETGIYQVRVGSFSAAGSQGTALPNVRVIYKLAPATTLDLHFHFLDLTEHPCPDARDLNAELAINSPSFQDLYLNELETIFAAAGITIGVVSYQDVERPDLDGLRAQDLPRLGRLSQQSNGLHVFFTRSIVPGGVQALTGGRPGPPNTPGTRGSAIAVGLDMLCYRQWRDVARASAHELAQHMGLYRNREPTNDKLVDPIPDSDKSPDNLMYFSEFGGTELSPGQAEVLQSYPGLR